MDANTLKTGERIEHPLHGPGTIRFVGTDYLGIDFDRGGEALIRREAWEAVGGYDEHMPYMGVEDWEFWLNLSFNGHRFYYLLSSWAEI